MSHFVGPARSGLEVIRPVEVLDAKADAEVLVFFLGRAGVGELDHADLGRLPGELFRHALHGLPVQFYWLHELGSLLHGELAQHLADDALLVLKQLQRLAAIRSKGTEHVEDTKVLVEGLHDARVLELVLDEVDVPHVPHATDSRHVDLEAPLGV